MPRSSTVSAQTGRPYGVLLFTIVLIQLAGSLAYPVAKFGLTVIEPFTFAFFRFLLASVVLLASSAMQRHRVRVARDDYARIIFLGVLIIPLNQTLFLLGQSMTAAGHGAFIFGTTPIWIFVLALIHLKEPFLWRRAIGILIALFGVTLIMVAGPVELAAQYLLGDVIILVAVIAWGYYTVLGKPLVQKYGALRVTAYALASGSLIYFPFGLYQSLRYDYSQATLAAWASVVYLAVGLSMFMYVLWYWVLKHMEASRLAVYHNVQPVIATIIACVWLGEQVDTLFMVGATVVLAGVVVTEL